MNKTTMTENQKQALAFAVCSTVEAMAFAELTPVNASEVPADWSLEDYEGAAIRLSTSNLLVGTLTILAPNSFLNDLAGTILHCDSSDIPCEGRTEACLELANMIAGGFCRGVVDAGGLFELGLPESLNRNAIDKQSLLASAVVLALEDGKLLLASFSHQTA